jgi:hypothetical protein
MYLAGIGDVLLQVCLFLLEGVAESALLLELGLQAHRFSADLIVPATGIRHHCRQFVSLIRQGMRVGPCVSRAVDDL